MKHRQTDLERMFGDQKIFFKQNETARVVVL